LEAKDLEAKVKALAETAEKLEARITAAEDIEAIKKLQRSYGYYLEHWQEEQLLGLWSHSPDTEVELNETGLFKGWEGVQKCFHFADHYTAFNGEITAPPEYLHILMPGSGIVHLDPGGKTAKGRWYGFFLGALPRRGQLRALIGCGIWENEYIKENGIWKLKKVFWNDIISSPLDEGWVKTPYLSNPPMANRPPSGPNTHFQTYPSGYIFPYHYKNPVTGK
jgi:hypothetical protein